MTVVTVFVSTTIAVVATCDLSCPREVSRPEKYHLAYLTVVW